ncbi:[Protein-PII] uridylyltransferase [Labilithrix luteola]|uniref:[Protein-PII] uridylyltransferase n=1 Tax=Labilithrix luteola TaxID=1391654 RepID=A0A0K1PZA8_9BACT|nr:hypothetical protein [Labilithrix luteola]AKU98827.1 [Protein-PII] uridylyltransferase [Labilithrix luteola]
MSEQEPLSSAAWGNGSDPSVRGDLAESETGETTASFIESMPLAYRATFDTDAIEAHAGIVRRRAAHATRVELWRELSERVAAICIVADDRPGLFSQISAALVAYDIDVVAAEAYCRIRPDTRTTEAVGFLWIRRLAPGGAVLPVRARDVARIGEMVEALATGEATFEASLPRSIPAPTPATSVRFEEDPTDGSTVLTVEAVDKPGLLLIVTQALFRAGIHITNLRAKTENGRARDRFVLAERDGGALSRERLLTLQGAIFEAIERS